MSQLNSEDRAQLREFLADRFNLDEMKTLCFDLGVDYEEFPHATKTELSRELISYFERQEKLGCLVAEMVQARPDEWLAALLAQVSSCRPNQKVQIVLSNDKIKSRPDLKQKLAELLGVSVDEVMILATAPGSVKVLVGLPPEATAKLVALPLPYQLVEYRLVAVTLFANLPRALQTRWYTAVTQTAVTTSATAATTGGLSLALKIIIGILILIGVIVVGVLVWGGGRPGLPELQVHNQCATPLPIPAPDVVKSLLNLPGEIPVGGTITVPILTGEGTYEFTVTRRGIMLLRLPKPIPGIGLDEVELGTVDPNTAVTLNGQLLTPPGSFQIASGQAYELVICAPRR